MSHKREDVYGRVVDSESEWCLGTVISHISDDNLKWYMIGVVLEDKEGDANQFARFVRLAGITQELHLPLNSRKTDLTKDWREHGVMDRDSYSNSYVNGSRRSGKTTRDIDQAVQTLFNYLKLEAVLLSKRQFRERDEGKDTPMRIYFTCDMEMRHFTETLSRRLATEHNRHVTIPDNGHKMTYIVESVGLFKEFSHKYIKEL